MAPTTFRFGGRKGQATSALFPTAFQVKPFAQATARRRLPPSIARACRRPTGRTSTSTLSRCRTQMCRTWVVSPGQAQDAATATDSPKRRGTASTFASRPTTTRPPAARTFFGRFTATTRPPMYWADAIRLSSEFAQTALLVPARPRSALPTAQTHDSGSRFHTTAASRSPTLRHLARS
jgi:hypothetical protein